MGVDGGAVDKTGSRVGVDGSLDIVGVCASELRYVRVGSRRHSAIVFTQKVAARGGERWA